MHSTSRDIYGTLSAGTVVDTNDPQQMGRIRVRVPAYGDTPNSILENLPWCTYVAPFGGVTTGLSRGNDLDSSKNFSEGQIAYGMWNIPKLGARVLVGCIDGDPASRFWIGCLFEEQLVHTMPHGRFSYDPSSGNGAPDGPLSSSSSPVMPLYENLRKAFKSFLNNFEWRSRGADSTVAAYTQQVQGTFPYEPFDTDDESVSFTEEDGHAITSRQGYDVSRLDPDRKPTETKENLDSQVYSWVSPGFHAISMDDRLKNCRMRLRTATGHQILLDDTNERIYISTNEGANWIEMDSDGSIDIFGTQRISIHAENDINLTSNKTIRMYAKDSIHLHADNEIRTHSVKDTHFVSDENIRMRSTQEFRVSATGNLQLNTEAEAKLEAANDFNIKGNNLKFESTVKFNLKSGGQMLLTATPLHLNGPTADSADSAEVAEESLAFWTNRVPDHEPWGRISTKTDFSHDPKVNYNDPSIGKEHKTRGPLWHR